jgi:hypothetical protein
VEVNSPRGACDDGGVRPLAYPLPKDSRSYLSPARRVHQRRRTPSHRQPLLR